VIVAAAGVEKLYRGHDLDFSKSRDVINQPTNLERFTSQYGISWVIVYIPPAVENLSLFKLISQIFPGH